MSFQVDVFAARARLPIETLIGAFVPEEVVFVRTVVAHFCLGGCAHEQVIRHAHLGARYIGFVLNGAACRSLQYKSRLFGNDAACGNALRHCFIGGGSSCTGLNVRDDVSRAARGNFKVLIF